MGAGALFGLRAGSDRCRDLPREGKQTDQGGCDQGVDGDIAKHWVLVGLQEPLSDAKSD
jgi:hypothetical protein